MTNQREPVKTGANEALHLVAHRLQRVDATASPRASMSGAAATNAAAAQRAVARASVNGGKQKQTVLRQVVLVDRDIDALRDIAIALRDEYDFHITISGAEALNLLRDGGIDTIVVGQTLYSSTGLNVLAEARKHAPNTHRVLLANAAEAAAIRASVANVAPFRVMERPCTLDKLRDLLQARAAQSPTAPVSAQRPNAHAFPLNDAPPAKPAPGLAKPPTETHAPEDFEHVVLETPVPWHSRTRPNAAADALRIVVYTDNAEFYQSIAVALQDRHDAQLCTQLERATEMAEIGLCPILITDRAHTQVELQRISIALRSVDGSVVIIAAGGVEVSAALRKFFGTGALHSFLPTPLNPPLVRLAVESAKRQYLQNKALHAEQPNLTLSAGAPFLGTPIATPPKSAPALQLAPTPQQSVFIPSFNNDFGVDNFAEPAWRRYAPKIGVAVAVVALIVGIGFGARYLWQQYESRPKRPIASETTASPVQLGMEAYDENRIVAPAGNNALYYYKQALDRTPGDERALRGMERSLDRAFDIAERAIINERLADAETAITAIREAQPNNKRLAFLENQLGKEKTKQDDRSVATVPATQEAVTTPTPASASRGSAANLDPQQQQSVARWITIARQRMAENRLVTPENDSAEYYLRLAQRVDPENPTGQSAMLELGDRLLSYSREALASQQLDTAKRRLNDAIRVGAEPSKTQGLLAEIQAADTNGIREDYLRLVVQRTRENRLFEPDNDSAKYYLDKLQRLDPEATETTQALRVIALNLLDNAARAIDQQQFTSASQFINEVQRLGYTGPEFASAQTQLRQAQNPNAQRAVATASIAPPKVIKNAAATYPDEALRANVEGWVDVSFHITPQGDVRDAAAVASDPQSDVYAAQFRKAAIAAVNLYKFEARPDIPYTQTMVVRVQFKMK